MGTNWHAVADALAGRLMYHTYCEAHDSLDSDCPFCEDIAAYERYLKAGGTVRRFDYDTDAVAVPVLPSTGLAQTFDAVAKRIADGHRTGHH